MKAIIGRQIVLSAMDLTHGGGDYIRSLVVEELDGLCFHVVEGVFYAFNGFDLKFDKYDRLGEVEVPQSIVDKAVKVAKINTELRLAKAELKNDIPSIKKLIGS